MLAGNIIRPRTIELIDVPEPPPCDTDRHRGQIIFAPQLACLCGSDLLFFEADYPEFQPQIGHSLHEMIGTVVDTSGQRFKVGDRVLCIPDRQLGVFERFGASENRAIAIDRRLSDEQVVLSQPLGTVIHGLRKLPNLINASVAVVGQGPIGQLFCAVVRNLGARCIIAIDRLASRLETSPRMGATDVVDASQQDPTSAVDRITGGTMADLVVEAVGHREQALNDCIAICRPQRGRILFFGVPQQRIDQIEWLTLVKKNLTVHTSIDPDYELDFPLAMRWIAEERIDVTPIITHHFPLSQIQTAFETFYERRGGALKVFVEFGKGAGSSDDPDPADTRPPAARHA